MKKIAFTIVASILVSLALASPASARQASEMDWTQVKPVCGRPTLNAVICGFSPRKCITFKFSSKAHRKVCYLNPREVARARAMEKALFRALHR